MDSRSSTFALLFITAVIAAIVLPVATLEGSVLTYPSLDCDTTLQACIESALPGDVIQLCHPANIDEDLGIVKSLTLTGSTAPGCGAPVIGGSSTMRTIYVWPQPGGMDSVDVNLSLLHLVNARVFVMFTEGTYHRFRLADSDISGLPDDNLDAIYLHASTDGSFNIENNYVAGRLSCISEPDALRSRMLRITGNRMTSSNPAYNNAVAGMSLSLTGEGENDVYVDNNLIYNTYDPGGTQTYAIGLWASDTATNRITIQNNTIDDVYGGIRFFDPGVTSNSRLNAFNNIVTNTVENWITLPAATPALIVSTSSNSFYLAGTSGDGGYPLWGNDKEDPLYVDASVHNYRLQDASPCINDGIVWAWTASDITGNARVMGSAVDRGCYEAPAHLGIQYAKIWDVFGDSTLCPDYQYLKGSWSEDGHNLIGKSERKAVMLLPETVACDVCKAHFILRTSGADYDGITPKMWILLWYKDKQNYIEMLFKPEVGAILLRQKANGVIVRKDKTSFYMPSHTNFTVDVENDGSRIGFYFNGLGPNYYPLAVPSVVGRFGFQSKATTGYISDITIHE